MARVRHGLIALKSDDFDSNRVSIQSSIMKLGGKSKGVDVATPSFQSVVRHGYFLDGHAILLMPIDHHL